MSQSKARSESTSDMTDADPHRTLDELGYLFLPDMVRGDELARLKLAVENLYQEEGERAGAEFKQEAGSRRLANMVNKGELFRELVSEATVLAAVRAVLGDRFKLSSLNGRSVNPQSTEPQPLHCDMGAIADEEGYWVCNAVWMLDDFTVENGALRVVPGSHRWRRLPQDEMPDPRQPHPDEILLTGTAGSVVVFNAHLWHGGAGNFTDKPRTAVHAFYCRYDKPQQQYQKRMLDAAVIDSLSLELRKLLAIDDPLNDELSTAPAQTSGFLK